MKLRIITLMILAAVATLTTAPANAVYNANMAGVLTDLYIYADSDSVYFRLSNQPTTHPGCSPAYFVLTGVPEARLNRLVARLMEAKATEEVLNIGYDSSGDCAEGYIRAHRIG